MTVILVFATLKEATPTIDALTAIPHPTEPSVWEFNAGLVVITGMGALQASIFLSSIIKNTPCEIWNWGIAGALNDRFELGQILEISTVHKFHGASALEEHSLRLFNKCHPAINFENTSSGLERGRLITSDFPIYDTLLRDTLGKEADLVDMEGYGIALLAQHLKRPLRLFKTVSDFAKPGHAALLATQLPQLAQQASLDLLRNYIHP